MMVPCTSLGVKRGSIVSRIANRRDLAAGSVIALVGLIGIVEGYRLGLGTLRKMEPGFVPMAVGFVLFALGAVAALNRESQKSSEPLVFNWAEWRGWVLIVIRGL